MLEIVGIEACYGSIQALWDVSFRVDQGEVVTILGSNGAGKSTAIHVAQGLIRPTSGETRFLGEVIQRLSPHQVVERGLCLVPEARHLFPHMSVLENLELGAYPRKARVVREETLQWIYNLFPILQRRKKQRAGTLSGGEQQMVAIGRGLMAKPSLLMMDEPSLGLAPLIVAELFRIISEINEHGLSILLVEQNARHALSLASRAYVMETGRITHEGSGKELLADPSIRTAYLGM
ncbi:MAG: ABC transporter ATP-binding protein [Deltaproteobacteria bacterium]|jgi:branched-chain amino acid transport system ATP-binding protein|nr:ABC transporter ATP-binding protein [Deltaproteobacteria bacterium]